MFKFIKTRLIFFKSTIYWFYLLKLIIVPFIILIWNVANIKAFFLKLLWFKKNHNDYYKIPKTGFLKVTDNNQFKLLAKKINKEAISLLDKSKKNAEDKVLENSNFFLKSNEASFKKVFFNELFYDLSLELRKEIIDFSSSAFLLSTATSYLGVFPIIHKIQVTHNFPVEGSNQRGSMLWHKDDFGFKCLDVFIAVNDINDQNGPLSVIKSYKQLGSLAKIKNEIQNPIRGERGKVYENDFRKIFKSNDEVFKGNIGTALFVDSFSCYHKGGFCISKDRLILRITYRTIENSSGLFYKENFEENQKNNIFKKFCLTHHSKFLYFLNLKKIMLKLIRFFSYKII